MVNVQSALAEFGSVLLGGAIIEFPCSLSVFLLIL